MAKYDPRMAMYEEQTRFSGMIYVLMLVVVVAFAGFVWNFYSGDETGKLTPETRAGLKLYQAAEGLKVTGTLNKTTLEKMGIVLTEKQKAM